MHIQKTCGLVGEPTARMKKSGSWREKEGSTYEERKEKGEWGLVGVYGAKLVKV